MASNNHGRGNDEDNHPASQPIPLQDLPSLSDTAVTEERGRRRQSGARRSLLPGRESLRNYERISESSSPETSSADNNPFPHPHASDGEHNGSVVDDLGVFAQAMSSVGLRFDGPRQTTPTAARVSHDYSDSELDNIPLSTYNSNDPAFYLSPAVTNEDTARLTDQTYLQPISGASTAAERSSTHTVHFDDGVSSGSRLGDDLPHLESGLGGRRRRGSSSAGDRSRSLSPSASSSALYRASSMMKSMSQRVVNLSNEPEVVEQSIQKEESWKSARLEGPPQLPAMADYAHDSPSGGPFGGHARGNKKPGLNRAWKRYNNPLKGRAICILAPDNPVRTWLCDVLVHPLTEPLILLLIVLQTILLAIESSSPKSAWNNSMSGRWGSSHMDYVFLGIFIIYTLETISRILVSGFIFNPVEYSTLDRSLGLKKAVVQRGKNILAPQRQMSTKKPTVPVEPQTSIIRTFTGLNQLEEQAVDNRQRQRTRLAHRAFLRHSFNRLDFVAVVSFWIYFFLSLNGVEAHRLFRMLSCLRILRLLAVTNGTSVSQKTPVLSYLSGGN